MKSVKSIALALSLVSLAMATQAQVTIGVVGDSLSDEYLDSDTAANTDLAAYSWVEILAQTRQGDFNFGEYRGYGDEPWKDHRALGYQYNYAKVAGATSNDARMRVPILGAMKIDRDLVGSKYVSDQVTGLLSEDGVEYAVVAAGSNDYFYYTHDFSFSGEASRNKNDPDLTFNSDIATTLLAHAGNLHDKGIKVLLAYVPEGTAGGDMNDPEYQPILEVGLWTDFLKNKES